MSLAILHSAGTVAVISVHHRHEVVPGGIGLALPVRAGERHLYGGHLVLRAVGRPVGVLGGHHVGAGDGVVERGVHDPGRHAVGELGAQRRLPDAAGQGDHVAVVDAADLGVVRMQLEYVLGVPGDIGGAAGLRADVVLTEDTARGEDQGEAPGAAFAGRHVGGDHE